MRRGRRSRRPCCCATGKAATTACTATFTALAFPFQATFLLSQPGADFTGGEFLLVENRMRMQAMGEAVPLERGDMVVFPVRDRPVAGRRGPVRAEMRHGVSRVRSGERFTLGIIFHDAA